MNLLMIFSGAGLLVLTACGVSQTGPKPTVQQIAAVACLVDGVTQPIGAAVLGGLVPEAVAGIAIDQAAVHPAVIKFCAALGGTPTAATVQTTVTPMAPPAAKKP